MRSAALTALATLAATLASATPALSLDRPINLSADTSWVVRVANPDRPPSQRLARYRHADTYWNWRERARHTRWLHNEYVNAGHPVRHAYSRTYTVVVDDCCRRGHR